MEFSKESQKSEYNSDQEAAKHDLVEEPYQDDARVPAIKRKVDLRLSAILALLYCVNQIDRNNLPNAVVAGMDEDLGLVGNNRYPVIVLVFFPTYIIFNAVATVLARKLGPRPFLSAITLSFGLVVIGFGLVDSWTHMIGLRILLGAFESCFFPSALFLVSMWYTRREVAKRNAFFYLLGNSVGGFGGVLAYGLQQMDGVQNHAGWRWIFIWEGILTIIIAIVAFIFLVDFPEDAHKSKFFLKDDELKIMIDRVEYDRKDAHVTPFSMSNYLAQGKDWKVWFFATNFGLSGTVTYAIAYFLPIILRDSLGFSVAKAQCLTAPCYCFSFLLGFTESWLSDKYNKRAHVIIFNCVLEIIGIAVLGFAGEPYVRYFGAFLVTAGVNANIPASMTYQANNIVGQWKRAFASATMVAAGGIGGIIGVTVFRSQDAPDYVPGLVTCFLAVAIVIMSTSTTTVYFVIQNRKQANEGKILEGVEGFRYTL